MNFGLIGQFNINFATTNGYCSLRFSMFWGCSVIGFTVMWVAPSVQRALTAEPVRIWFFRPPQGQSPRRIWTTSFQKSRFVDDKTYFPICDFEFRNHCPQEKLHPLLQWSQNNETLYCCIVLFFLLANCYEIRSIPPASHSLYSSRNMYILTRCLKQHAHCNT
jgi:hypothetical protein